MPITEHTINDSLAGLLRETRFVWQVEEAVSSENTGMLRGNAKRPDILVVEKNVSPVTIETEVLPAVSVEAEAKARLGEHVRSTGGTILSSLAVRLPDRLRTTSSPQALLAGLRGASDLEMALYTGQDASNASRWPVTGWTAGTVTDLSLLTQLASVPVDLIDKAADELVNGVSEAAGLLDHLSRSHAGAIHKISATLHQEDGEQTRRMAATILANAFVFQESLAGGPGALGDVNSLAQLRGSKDGLNKSTVLTEWRKILAVNYWPIFDIARRILELIPAAGSRAVIDRLAGTADRLVENRLMRSHDLTGVVFQRLIADRKFLAAYYTTPASAALLVGLAVRPDRTPAGGTWADGRALTKLRVADFACGTGTLLSTAYHRLGQLHEMAGGNAEALHPDMMADVLVGCDVLPAAAHLTASMISGVHPAVKYRQSSIMTVAYGRQPDGSVALGSLELLDPQKKLDIVAITAKAAGATGETARDTWSDLPDASFDLVIMNPPFTRATGQEGKKVGVPNPMFAAFGSTEKDQRQMAKATERLAEGTSAHGNAGEASIFLALADHKIKPGGTLALVMPLSLLTGEAWEASRALLARQYGSLILVSISAAAAEDMSFSADTGMGECLVVGRKEPNSRRRATFVVLKRRPDYPMVGERTAEMLGRLVAAADLRQLEEGPVGGTPLYFGDELIGEALDAPLPPSGGWNPTRIADLSLAQAAYQLGTKGRVWLPGVPRAHAVVLPITHVGKIGNLGPYHADINGTTATGGIRGPFEVAPVAPGGTPTYPVLWAHEAERERTMVFEADCEGRPRHAKARDERLMVEFKVKKVWSAASHAHYNQNFQFNSQATAWQFTRRKTIGGRAWPSVKLKAPDHEKALVTWGNTTLGLLLHWYHANKQQAGRGNVVPTQLETMPILDVTALTAKALKRILEAFDELATQELLPIHRLAEDPVRRLLDERIGRALGVPASWFTDGGVLDILRRKLAAEPSIRGAKSGAVPETDRTSPP